MPSHVQDTAVDPDRSPHWVPARDALWCTHGDVTHLLSLETGTYHTLDEVGGTIWLHLAAGEPLEQIAASVAEEFGGVPVEEVLSDIRELVADLSARRLLEPTTFPPPKASLLPRFPLQPVRHARRVDGSHSPTRPSVFRSLVCLLVVHALLKTVGLRQVLRWIARATPAALGSASDEWVSAAVECVGRAMVWYPFRAACLEHSVSILWLVREGGGDVSLRIGVRPFPFAAHAWVERGGRPLNDSAEHVALYKAFPAIDVRPR